MTAILNGTPSWYLQTPAFSGVNSSDAVFIESKISPCLKTLSTCAFVAGLFGMQSNIPCNQINEKLIIQYNYVQTVFINNSSTTLNSSDLLSKNFMDNVMVERRISERVTSIETHLEYIKNNIDKMGNDIEEIKSNVVTKSNIKMILWVFAPIISVAGTLSLWAITHFDKVKEIANILSRAP